MPSTVPASSADPVRGTRVVRRAGRAILNWAPVWVPVGLGVQIALLGLRPALQEHRRLASEESVLRALHAELSAERTELDLTLRAQSDPLYLERERRSLLDPAGALRK